MTENNTMTLRLGFDLADVGPDTTARAIAEWRVACDREGLTTADGEVTVTIVADDPAHTAMGQYVIEVTGQVSDGLE